jgi:DNA-binding NarL/FixJ family response regulator
MFEDDDTVFAAVSAGAAGYLLKGSAGPDIVTAVRAASAGQAVFGPALARRLSTWFATAPAAQQPPFPELTERERAILDGVAAGLSNAQIGQRLFLSPKTVANNVSTILAKLQLSQRTEAALRAREAGLGHAERPPDGPRSTTAAGQRAAGPEERPKRSG